MHDRLRSARLRACAAMVVVSALLGGCAHVNHLREAQDTFNQTAALENKYRFDPASVPPPVAIEAGYAAVIVSLDNLANDTDAVRSLRGDKLYGNALALKALAYWRLHSHDKAKAAVQAARAEGLDPLSRDSAFLDALPGLIKSDQAYARLYGPLPPGAPVSNARRLEDVGALIDSAQVDLDAARKALPERHPMRVYLAFAELAALKNLADACFILEGKATVAALECFEKRRINCRAQSVARAALELGADPSTVKLVAEGTLSTDLSAAMPPDCK